MTLPVAPKNSEPDPTQKKPPTSSPQTHKVAKTGKDRLVHPHSEELSPPSPKRLKGPSGAATAVSTSSSGGAPTVASSKESGSQLPPELIGIVAAYADTPETNSLMPQLLEAVGPGYGKDAAKIASSAKQQALEEQDNLNKAVDFFKAIFKGRQLGAQKETDLALIEAQFGIKPQRAKEMMAAVTTLTDLGLFDGRYRGHESLFLDLVKTYFPGIQYLTVDASLFSFEFLVEIVRALPLLTILEANSLPDHGFDKAAALLKQLPRSLQELRLNGIYFAILSSIPSDLPLTTLRVSGRFHCLEPFSLPSSVKIVELTNTGVASGEYTRLLTSTICSSCPHLEALSLDLGHCSGDLDFSKLSSTVRLSLKATQADDSVVMQLPSSTAELTLLGYNRFTASTGRHLSKLTQLQSLNLIAIDLQPGAFTEMPPSIQTVRLQSCSFTNEYLNKITETTQDGVPLPDMRMATLPPNLVELELTSNLGCTDATLNILRTQKNLKKLILKQGDMRPPIERNSNQFIEGNFLNCFSQHALEGLKQALPQLVVTFK